MLYHAAEMEINMVSNAIVIICTAVMFGAIIFVLIREHNGSDVGSDISSDQGKDSKGGLKK